jgi:hypothetical protein
VEAASREEAAHRHGSVANFDLGRREPIPITSGELGQIELRFLTFADFQFIEEELKSISHAREFHCNACPQPIEFATPKLATGAALKAPDGERVQSRRKAQRS